MSIMVSTILNMTEKCSVSLSDADSDPGASKLIKLKNKPDSILSKWPLYKRRYVL